MDLAWPKENAWLAKTRIVKPAPVFPLVIFALMDFLSPTVSALYRLSRLYKTVRIKSKELVLFANKDISYRTIYVYNSAFRLTNVNNAKPTLLNARNAVKDLPYNLIFSIALILNANWMNSLFLFTDLTKRRSKIVPS